MLSKRLIEDQWVSLSSPTLSAAAQEPASVTRKPIDTSWRLLICDLGAAIWLRARAALAIFPAN